VEAAGTDALNTVARSVKIHYESVLNFFDNSAENASAESFNASKLQSYFKRGEDMLLFSYSDLPGSMLKCLILQLFKCQINK